MDKFDEKVIGYDSIKETLRQIADVLKRPEAYKEKGVSMPRGLLMESAPGLGKSLMASILMEESGRKSFVFRRINEEKTVERTTEYVNFTAAEKLNFQKTCLAIKLISVLSRSRTAILRCLTFICLMK